MGSCMSLEVSPKTGFTPKITPWLSIPHVAERAPVATMGRGAPNPPVPTASQHHPISLELPNPRPGMRVVTATGDANAAAAG